MSEPKRKTIFSAVRKSDRILAVFLLVVFVSSGSCRSVAAPESSAAEEPETFNTYYNYAALTRRLQALAQRFPHIANLSSIGRSVEGRELWVMRITKEPLTDVPGKPKFKYVGNMHGDETVSRQVLLYLMEDLLSRYGDDQRATELVNNTDIYIMPSMNPDGFEKSVEGDCVGKAGGRNNAKNIDLNRRFPDQFIQINVNEAEMPENAAMMKWILDKKFVLSGNLHGGTVVASYPFDDSAFHTDNGFYSNSPDDALFRYLALVYAKNHPIMKTGEPKCEGEPDETFKDGITNGAHWYDVPETRTWERNSFEAGNPTPSVSGIVLPSGRVLRVNLPVECHCKTSMLKPSRHSQQPELHCVLKSEPTAIFCTRREISSNNSQHQDVVFIELIMIPGVHICLVWLLVKLTGRKPPS